MHAMSSGKYRSIILGCILYNLLTEMWVHGIIGFMNPILTISLLILYSTYFLMLEDLIVRYRLHDIPVFLIGIIFGLWHETFTTGNNLKADGLYGLDPFVLVVANLFWWGIMQTVMARYFANRSFGPRDTDHKKMGRIGWGICLFFNLSAISNYVKYPEIPVEAYIIVFILIGVLVTLLKYVKKPVQNHEFIRSKFLDILLILHLALCLGIGLTVGSMANAMSTTAFVYWSLLFGVCVIGYWVRNRSISV